jgi:hypothetical protein
MEHNKTITTRDYSGLPNQDKTTLPQSIGIKANNYFKKIQERFVLIKNASSMLPQAIISIWGRLMEQLLF